MSVFTKTVWQDRPNKSTPINAENLNRIENGIGEAFSDINALNLSSLKFRSTLPDKEINEFAFYRHYEIDKLEDGTYYVTSAQLRALNLNQFYAVGYWADAMLEKITLYIDNLYITHITLTQLGVTAGKVTAYYDMSSDSEDLILFSTGDWQPIFVDIAYQAEQSYLAVTADNALALQGATLDTDVSLTANEDEKIPSQKAVKSYIDSKSDLLLPRTTTINEKLLTENFVLNKSDLGLNNVDNTSDLNKPVSTATQNELNKKVAIENNKGLSSNDYTDADKEKLNNMSALTTGGKAVDSALLNGSVESKESIPNTIVKRGADGKIDLSSLQDIETDVNIEGKIYSTVVLVRQDENGFYLPEDGQGTHMLCYSPNGPFLLPLGTILI